MYNTVSMFEKIRRVKYLEFSINAILHFAAHSNVDDVVTFLSKSNIA
jgi:hypothetical protein